LNLKHPIAIDQGCALEARAEQTPKAALVNATINGRTNKQTPR